MQASINNHLFYKKSIAQFGVSARGVHWNSKFSQYKRFEVLTAFIKKKIKDATIVDAGCGFAEYYNFLRKKELLPQTYYGIDCEAQMIAVCKKRFPNLCLDTKDILQERLPMADYYICSGAMNLLNKKDFFQFIKQCYAHSKKGFAFNFLKSDSFNEIKAHEVVEFCQQLNGIYVLEEHYLENDLSIFLKKQ